MAAGNRARNRPKGFHLSADGCEMLEQLVIVAGKSESFWADEGIRQLFMRYKQQYAESFGAEYWAKCLESMSHIDRLINRRRVIKERE